MRFLLILIAVFLHAKIVNECLKVAADGINKNEAIKNALVLAISEYRGLSIAQVQVLKRKINNVYLNDKEVNYLKDEYSNKIISSTGGVIKSFRILDEARVGNGYRVVLKVCFNAYKDSGYLNSRKAIAFFPFIGDDNLEFSRFLLEKLSQTRKFNVIDRLDSSVLDLENLFWLKPTTRKEEIIKLQKRIGSDYILVGRINLSKDVRYEKLPLLDRVKRVVKYKMKVEYKIFDSVRGILKWANSFEIEAKDKQSLFEIAAKRIIDDMIFNIYPPRIVKVDDKRIIINYGKGVLKKGDILYIFSAKKPLYDPYTKEFLGYEEKKVGIAKIIRVTPKFSVAVFRGEAKEGYILRKAE